MTLGLKVLCEFRRTNQIQTITMIRGAEGGLHPFKSCNMNIWVKWAHNCKKENQRDSALSNAANIGKLCTSKLGWISPLHLKRERESEMKYNRLIKGRAACSREEAPCEDGWRSSGPATGSRSCLPGRLQGKVLLDLFGLCHLGLLLVFSRSYF